MASFMGGTLQDGDVNERVADSGRPAHPSLPRDPSHILAREASTDVAQPQWRRAIPSRQGRGNPNPLPGQNVRERPAAHEDAVLGRRDSGLEWQYLNPDGAEVAQQAAAVPLG